MVLDLSEAEIPVVQPLPIRSTETVNGVSKAAVFFPIIKSRPNSSHLFSRRGVQIKPLPCVAIKFIISGVTFSAAATKSPSFSLFSSSITITTLPSLMSFIASSIVLNFIFKNYFAKLVIYDY